MIVEPKVTPNSMKSKIMADNPPAYSIHPGSRMVLSSHPPPPATGDQVHIFSRHEDINGTFYIDPHVPSLDPRRRKSKGKSQPHASFGTRKANISVDLGITGNVYDGKKANVAVTTHQGDIKVNLLPTVPVRPLGLDVTSRKGDILLFLPETFSGVIHLRTKKGELTVLPALKSTMKIVKASDKEVIFMITPQHSSNGADSSHETSLCQLNTRKGSVVVGLSGHDQYASQPGFWKRLGCYLRGSVKH